MIAIAFTFVLCISSANCLIFTSILHQSAWHIPSLTNNMLPNLREAMAPSINTIPASTINTVQNFRAAQSIAQTTTMLRWNPPATTQFITPMATPAPQTVIQATQLIDNITLADANTTDFIYAVRSSVSGILDISVAYILITHLIQNDSPSDTLQTTNKDFIQNDSPSDTQNRRQLQNSSTGTGGSDGAGAGVSGDTGRVVEESVSVSFSIFVVQEDPNLLIEKLLASVPSGNFSDLLTVYGFEYAMATVSPDIILKSDPGFTSNSDGEKLVFGPNIQTVLCSLTVIIIVLLVMLYIWCTSSICHTMKISPDESESSLETGGSEKTAPMSEMNDYTSR